MILKWGVDALQNAVLAKHDGNVSLTLEAMRARNEIVLKRYDHAYSACEALFDLVVQIDSELDDLKALATGDSSAQKKANFIKSLGEDFHPKKIRIYRKLRSKFEVTNDLLSGYSLETGELVSFSTFKEICRYQERANFEKKMQHIEEKFSGAELENEKKKVSEFPKITDICSLYRALWTHVSGIMSACVRISSNDLRFWLTDTPYVRAAEECAKFEARLAKAYFCRKKHETYGFLLEDQKNIELFWSGDLKEMVSTYGGAA